MKDEYELREDIDLLRDQLRLANVDQANTEAELNDLQGAYDAMKAERDEARTWLKKCLTRLEICGEQDSFLYKEVKRMSEGWEDKGE